MSAPINDGPAFPLGDSCWDYRGSNRSENNGMTLRDYFAAKCMVYFLDQCDYSDTKAAHRSYEMADAMLNERAALARAGSTHG